MKELSKVSPPVSRGFNKALHTMPNCKLLSIGQVIWKNIGTQRLVLPQNPRSAFGRRSRAGLIAVFSPVLRHAVGAVALPGRPIAILSIVFGIGEAFFARLPRQRLL